MAADDSRGPTVKKISPYPIESQITVPGGPKAIHIIKLTKEGALARTDKVLLKVGEYYQINFVLPVFKVAITAKVRILKTFDKSINPKDHVIERMAELHFEGLDPNFQKHIVAFLSAIGQNP